MAYGITSASQLIDVDTIQNGCDMVVDATKGMLDAGNSIMDASDTCTPKVLSLSTEIAGVEASEQVVLERLSEIVKDRADVICSYVSSISSAAYEVYNAQVAELNEYNRRLAEANNHKSEEVI